MYFNVNLKLLTKLINSAILVSELRSSFLSSTSALVGSGKSTSRPDRFTHVKETRLPLYTRVVGPQGRSGYARKISQNKD